MTTQTAGELTRNPTTGTWGYQCTEHGILRSGLTQTHAINVEAKHIREDHTPAEAVILANLVLDVTALAVMLMAEQDPNVLLAWCALTGLEPDTAIDVANHIVMADTSVLAAVVPL